MIKKTAKEVYVRVAESYDNGHRSTREIAEDTGIPQRTVARYLDKYRRGIPVIEVQNRGRPSLLSQEDIACLISLLSENQFLTSKQLCAELNSRRGVEVTPMTIRNHLHRLEYRNGLPRNVPVLTEAAKEKRLRFAVANEGTNWDKDFFLMRQLSNWVPISLARGTKLGPGL
jgi:transposase